MPVWKCFPCMWFQSDEVISKLDYSNCALTDVPPDVSQHERTLEELYLSSNRIKTLSPQLFYCQSIRILFVNDNELESLPNAIGSLRQLQTLNLVRNGLCTVPDNIKACKNLTRLELSLNNLEKLPEAITSLISLQELLLNETNLQFLPANFGRLVNLRILELRSNNLITLPKSMSRLINLTRIDIGSNEFTELPEVICQLTQLRELWIDVNRIRRISPNVSNLKELKHFEANNNLLLTLPNEISNWRNLEVLSISKNDMESLPFNIGMLKSLVTLQCDDNQLDELPDSICYLENLEEMVISHNFILRLPNTIGMLRKLRFFCADENVLRSLPTEICSCINLTVLSVRCNKIKELPQNIGHLINLNVLNLVDNCITYLPVSILSLSKLTALWISNNQSQPLVPLQYLNSSNKTHLTCFMLPQASYHEQMAQSDDFNSDNCSINSRLQQHDREKTLDRSTSPSHVIFLQAEKPDLTFIASEGSREAREQRLCFANDERLNNTITTQNDNVTSPSRRICFADEVKGTEVLGSRLMRSPTPYPKELRLMARYIRNHHPPGENSSTYSQKVEKIQSMQAQSTLSFSEQLNGSNQILRSSPQHRIAMGNEQDVRVLLNPCGNSTMIKQSAIGCHFVNTETGSEIEVSRDDGKASNIRSNHNNEINSMQPELQVYACPTRLITDMTNNQEQPQAINLKELNTNHETQHQQYYQCQNLLHPTSENLRHNGLDDDRLLYQETGSPLYHTEALRHLNASPSMATLNGQHNNAYQSMYNIQQQCRPPPYHIARALTKKSREDLLNYDTLRSQIHNGNILNAFDDNQDQMKVINNEVECYKGNSHDEQSHLDSKGLSHSFNDNDVDIIIENNNQKFSETYSIDSGWNLMSNQCVHLSENGCQGNEMHELFFKSAQSNHRNPTANCDESTGYEATHGTSPEQDSDSRKLKILPRSGSTTPWLFGTHKNPTVKQISIKRENAIGFDILEKSDQGIFVRETYPNTAAASLLCPDDKLLEVDGFDFTRIDLTCAKQILNDSGPVINVMISRT